MQAPCTVEIPRKYNDCYFYYYSTCTKGDNCGFRHEPLALGCETMCPLWQQGKCIEKRCKLRHMELRKNRKQIPCYWENQPGGCRKKHCPFMHKNPDARTDGIAPSQAGAPLHVAMGPVAPGMPEQLQGEAQMPAPNATPLLWPGQRQVVLDSSLLGVIPQGELLAGRPAPSPYTMPVDSLVVNFEEETKDGGRVSPIDEMVLLQKIQAESAAYYSYSDLLIKRPSDKKILDALITKNIEFRHRSPVQSIGDNRTRSISESHGVLSIDRKRKLSTHDAINTTKVLKVVRSNSIVYKKLDENQHNLVISDYDYLSRRRTCSEQSDVIEIHEEDYRDYFRYRRVKRPSITAVETPISDASDDYKDLSDASKIDTSDSEAHADESKIISTLDSAHVVVSQPITEISDVEFADESKIVSSIVDRVHETGQPISDFSDISKVADFKVVSDMVHAHVAGQAISDISADVEIADQSIIHKAIQPMAELIEDCNVANESVSDLVGSVTVESSLVSDNDIAIDKDL